ncbi:uncharacterized protein LOC132446394 isoform X3 [Gadus macrocephalus]|uniref:uncharacterized protein LOC132446394 isoform X3 n=1 Tax=Gadus macrocephalus TaxID=80720 RepID=UPI0028CB9879|nr:uncharacterized protein LOC132446394 isoform X3 [Gadus macrocephalus]
MLCCAVGCQNRNSVNSDLKFYRIAADNNSFNANRRRRWLQAIRRSDWNKDLIKNARLCSSHFISDLRGKEKGKKPSTDHQMMYSGPKKLVMRLLELACPQMTAEWSLVLINALKPQSQRFSMMI